MPPMPELPATAFVVHVAGGNHSTWPSWKIREFATAYAEQCVRDALEQAANVCEAEGHDEDRPGNYAYLIRALMDDKEKG